jgi:hypothetical protein
MKYRVREKGERRRTAHRSKQHATPGTLSQPYRQIGRQQSCCAVAPPCCWHPLSHTFSPSWQACRRQQAYRARRPCRRRRHDRQAPLCCTPDIAGRQRQRVPPCRRQCGGWPPFKGSSGERQEGRSGAGGWLVNRGGGCRSVPREFIDANVGRRMVARTPFSK